MGRSVEVAKEGDLAEGSLKQVSAEGHTLLLAMAGGRFYAAEGQCPHMGASLASGRLEGTVVTCPRHGSQFDLADGRMVRWAQLPGVASAISKAIRKPRGLKTYPVKVEAGKVLVEIP
ncbi:MAG: Rieske 2Fe-2S domain-containing protein [Dehalococcoidia bacterium]|nr:Rieske 2Fe-2S domain-containing protein [Dehalococcoidia bacterium]